MPKLDLNAMKGKPAAAPTPTPTPTEAPKPAGLAFLRNRGVVTETASAPQPKAEATEPAKPTPTPTPAAPAHQGGLSKGLAFLKSQPAKPEAVPVASPKPSQSGPVSDELQGLLDSEAGGAPAKPRIQSRFSDEVPADPPERDLADMDKSALQFVESLNSVYKIVHEPDLLGGVIKNIMLELSQKPEYRKLIAPKDIHTMIKGMRDSMGMARIKKEESKAKRAPAKKKGARIDDLELLNEIDDLLAGEK